MRAAHVDHGLHPQSAAWSAHCAATAAALGAEFVAARVAVDLTAGQGLEAAARDARYRVLGELLGARRMAADGPPRRRSARDRCCCGCCAARASAACAASSRSGRSRAVGWAGRCSASRASNCALKRSPGISLWLEDPSNQEPRHDRNYLRLHVLPALLARWPSAIQHAERLAEQMSEAEQLLDAVAAEDARALAAPWHVPRAALAALPPARQRNLLRYLLRAVGVGTPSARKVEELRAALLEARAGSRAIVRWPSGEGRVFREALYLGPPLPPSSPLDLRGAHRPRRRLDRPRRSARVRPGGRWPTACPSRGSPRG